MWMHAINDYLTDIIAHKEASKFKYEGGIVKWYA